MNSEKLIKIINDRILEQDAAADQVVELFGRKKSEPEPEPERARAEPGISKSSLQHIVTELFVKNPTEDRFVIFLDDRALTTLYLQSGGSGKKLLEIIDDAELDALANKKSRIVHFDTWNTLSDLITPPTNYSSSNRAVMIDYPKSLTNKFVDAVVKVKQDPNAEHKQKLRDEIARLLNHKYYVLTINITKAKKIAVEVDAAGTDTDALLDVFDPYVIENYPVKTVLNGARNEWYQKKDPGKQREQEVSKLEREAALKAREKKAWSTISGAPAKTKGLKVRLPALVFGGPFDADAIATEIKKELASTTDQEKVKKVLNDLHAATGHIEYKEVMDAVAALASWT